VRLIPVTVLAGTAGAFAPMLRRLSQSAALQRVLVVADPGVADAAPGCACCTMADGLTRALREAHFSRAHAFDRVLVDASGRDPRPTVAALARTPLASLRFAMSAIVCAESETDALSRGLADAAVDPARCAMEDLFAPGLYRDGALDARGWLDRALVPRITWSRPEPWDPADVEPAVQAIQLAAGERLLRLKGVVHVAGERGPRVVQAFGHTRYPSARLPSWPGPGRGTTLALATRPLDFAPIARILDLIPIRPTS